MEKDKIMEYVKMNGKLNRQEAFRTVGLRNRYKIMDSGKRAIERQLLKKEIESYDTETGE